MTLRARADRWQWVSPRSAASTARREAVHVLRRRGITLGAFAARRRRVLPLDEAKTSWEAADPVHLRRAFGSRFASLRTAIDRTGRTFERLRAGADFEREIWRRLGSTRAFEAAGRSTDLGDEREIEKVHVDRRRGGKIVAPDLWAKLSWISTDPRDRSLRIRFSFGDERLDDWRLDAHRTAASDDYAEAVFPECALLSKDRRFLDLLRRWTGTRVRLSERIVFSNAPGGGAAFHHDAETDQLGVAYAQLSGSTAWLALSKRRLAREVAVLAQGDLARAAGTERGALRALERHDLPSMERLLNRSVPLTRRLVEAGALTVLRAGDVFLLPSHGPDDAAWHSVFALGERPGLALSFGIFAA